MKPSICFVSMPIYHLLAESAESRFCGGAELQQLLIARELAARGYPITFVTLDHGQGPEQQLGPFRVLGAFKPGTGLPLLRFFHPRWSGIAKALNRADTDIYYLRGASFPLFPISLHAKRKGKYVVFAGASDTDFDKKSRKIPLARDRALYWQGLRSVDAVIAQNNHQAKRTMELLGIKAPVIHNAFPDSPAGLSSANDVLWVGNIRAAKNPERFVDLAESIAKQHFVMVGGIVKNKDYPMGPTTSNGCSWDNIPNIHYTGYLPPSKVEHYYGRAKVLVNTSDVEGFPNTFLHAWSWGVPVLTYVDPDSLVVNNGLGWVVKNPEEMKNVLKKVLTGELHYSPEHIAEFFRSECRTTRQVDKYESVFAELSKG